MIKKIISLIIFILVDIFIIFLSFKLAYILRTEIFPLIFPQFTEKPLFPLSIYLKYFYVVIVWILFFAYKKLYTKRFPIFEEIKILIQSTTMATIAIIIMIFIAKKQLMLSRTLIILAWLISLILFPFLRTLTKLFLIKINIWKKKLIIIGVNQASLMVLLNIKKNKSMGYEILGILDDDPNKHGKKYHGIKVLGPISELENITSTIKSKDIMISSLPISIAKLKQLLSKCEKNQRFDVVYSS